MIAPKIILVAPLLLFPISTSHAGEFDNWCMYDDGCVGEIPIQNNQFSTCEQNCTMSNSIKVQGMDAYLYDVSCVGDNGNDNYRMMMSKFIDLSGSEKGIKVTSSGHEEIVPCI